MMDACLLLALPPRGSPTLPNWLTPIAHLARAQMLFVSTHAVSCNMTRGALPCPGRRQLGLALCPEASRLLSGQLLPPSGRIM